MLTMCDGLCKNKKREFISKKIKTIEIIKIEITVKININEIKLNKLM